MFTGELRYCEPGVDSVNILPSLKGTASSASDDGWLGPMKKRKWVDEVRDGHEWNDDLQLR